MYIYSIYLVVFIWKFIHFVFKILYFNRINLNYSTPFTFICKI